MRFTVKLSKYEEEANYIDIKLVALNKGYIKTKTEELFFSSEILEKYAKELTGKPVLEDHEHKVSKIIGVVKASNFEDDKIVCTIRISKVGNEKIVELLKLDPSPITDVSIGAEIEKTKSEEISLVQKISFKELSLVFEGADPNAKIKEILLSGEKISMDLEKLTKSNIELAKEKASLSTELESIKLQLDVSNKEIASLKELAEIGKKYKEHLEKEVVKFVKISEGDKSPVLTLLSKADIDTLKALEEQYREKTKDKFKASSNNDKDLNKEITPEKLSKMNYKEILELSKSFNE